jgi:hypothetical protein
MGGEWYFHAVAGVLVLTLAVVALVRYNRRNRQTYLVLAVAALILGAYWLVLAALKWR